jgi:orotate phosphoribosyltransferase
METDRLRLLTLVRERAFRRGRFRLSSGRESDFYLDCKQVTLSAEGLSLVGRLLLAAIRGFGGAPVAAGGLTLGADPLAAAVALASEDAVARAEPGARRIDAFIVRKEPKTHGTEQWIEGTSSLVAGAEVVVLEDVITTGASTIRAIERCREAGLRVIGAVALVDREEDGGRAAVMEAGGCPVVALFTKGEIAREGRS